MMTENTYYNTIQEFKELFVDYLDNIFSVYDRELKMYLEEYNILSRKNNNIESSTAIGYVLEEFVVAKLSAFTNKKKNTKLLVVPAESPHLSYDCFCLFKDVKFIINIKAEKDANNGVAAINKLYNDYCKDDICKSFAVCKIVYDFADENKDRKIEIKDYSCYSIEEVDFSQGHMQDNRSWSTKQNLNSGRLVISKAFLEDHKMPENSVSWQTTKNQIELMYSQNDSSNKK